MENLSGSDSRAGAKSSVSRRNFGCQSIRVRMGATQTAQQGGKYPGGIGADGAATPQRSSQALMDYKLEKLCHEKSRGFYFHLLLKRKGRALLLNLPICIINTFSGK